MGITYSLKKGRRGRQERNWRRTYTLIYRAVTTDPAIGPKTVRQGCPVQLGSYYQQGAESDLGSFCSSVEATETDDDSCGWEVHCEFEPFDPTTYPQNPLDHPLKISWGFAKFERPAEVDINGKAILNSAGDVFFDPPVMVDDSRPLLHVVKKLATFDPAVARNFKDAINSDPFFGGDPYTWKCADISSGEPIFSQDAGTADNFYYEVAFEFEYNPDTWKRKILDQGLRELGSTASKQKAILDEKGQPVSSQVPLDGQGKRLAVGATPAYREFQLYKEKAFQDLGLDPTGAPGWGG